MARYVSNFRPPRQRTVHNQHFLVRTQTQLNTTSFLPFFPCPPLSVRTLPHGSPSWQTPWQPTMTVLHDSPPPWQLIMITHHDSTDSGLNPLPYTLDYSTNGSAMPWIRFLCFCFRPQLPVHEHTFRINFVADSPNSLNSYFFERYEKEFTLTIATDMESSSGSGPVLPLTIEGPAGKTYLPSTVFFFVGYGSNHHSSFPVRIHVRSIIFKNLSGVPL